MRVSKLNRRLIGILSARLCVAAATFALAAGANAQAPESGGLGNAAGYIVGFVQYVRWPVEDDTRSWRVCVAAPLGDKVDHYARRTARGRPFEVHEVGPRDDLAGCHVLDLSDASAADAKTLLERARRLTVLTVGEGERFCTAGGVACLRGRDGGAGFEINLSAAQQARLSVNAQLLMLGRRRQLGGGGS
jgi:hypothetical protein